MSASPWLIGDLVFGNASLFAAANASPGGAAVPSGWGPTDAGTVGWIPDANGGIDTPPILEGPGFASPGDPHYANGTYTGPRTGEVVLDQGLATALHVSVGDPVWIDPLGVSGPGGLAAWYANATAFRVVGVSEPFWLIPSALLAFVHLSEYQSLLGGTAVQSDTATLLLIHLADPSTATQDQTRVALDFPGLTVFTVGDILGAIASAVDLYRTFGEVVGVIGIVVATLFTTSVLLMSVDDRSREIAVLRALGFSRARIGTLVLEEALLLAGLGAGLGLVGGLIGAAALNRFLSGFVTGLPTGFSFVVFDANVLGTGIAEVLLIGLAASVIPMTRAVTLPVIEELRAP